ncbi:uncharacterized protein sS8_5547 [Methylocaldum marinum]|uniref:Uncharacterized protein n=1 Tax=Methylocaldum marinum TaxID=1432792 RepID=A0A286P492_9GAMM|nr:Imm49 family immunity protein [Methylocaldum marinum]BBA37464.1 uncharacterized protein sS8_5547 [Methylocaldum marinum]
MSNTPEQQQIDHWLKVARDGLTQTEEDFKSGFYEAENISIESVHTGTAMLYASLARAKFLNGDPIAEVRAEFANAARHILKSFRMAYDETDPDYQGEKADWTEVSELMAIDGFNFALMAADFDLAAELAGWFRDRPDGVRMDIEVNRYAHALKSVVLDDLPQARGLLSAQIDAYAAKPSKRNDYRKNYFTLSTALSGIADTNEARFNEGLAAQLKIYQSYARGEARNTDEEFICDHAVALANLGLRRGLAVTAEHPTLPRGLLIQP